MERLMGRIKASDFKGKFINMHTHTTRCQHAKGADEEYVRSAIDTGLDVLGFSDHAPYLFREGYVSPIRMRADELKGYVDSILDLKEKYKGKSERYCGLEMEYFAEYFDKTMEFIEQYPIDYFILDGIYAKYGFDYSFFESLSDAGLISTNTGITTYIKIYAMDEETIKCVKGKLRVRNNNNYDVFLNAPAFMLTQAGKELYKMLFESEISELDEAFLVDCKKCFDESLHMVDFNFLKNENVEIIYGQ